MYTRCWRFLNEVVYLADLEDSFVDGSWFGFKLCLVFFDGFSIVLVGIFGCYFMYFIFGCLSNGCNGFNLYTWIVRGVGDVG